MKKIADCLKNPDDESCKAIKWLQDYDLIYDDCLEYMVNSGEMTNNKDLLGFTPDLLNRNAISETSTEISTALAPNTSINKELFPKGEPGIILKTSTDILDDNNTLQMRIDETFNESWTAFPDRVGTDEFEFISVSTESPPISMTIDDKLTSFNEELLETESSTFPPPNFESRIFNPFNKDITNKNKINPFNTPLNEMLFPPHHHFPPFNLPPKNQSPKYPQFPHVGKYPGTSRSPPKCFYPSYPQMCSYLPQDDFMNYPIPPPAPYPCWNVGNQFPVGLIYVAPPQHPNYY